MKKNVLISGGAGFVGSALVKYLHCVGFEDIYVLDKCLFGYKHLLDFIPKERILKQSIRSFLAQEDLSDFKTIIHLSGLSNDPMADFDLVANNELNYVDTELLAQRAAKENVDRFIFASSASVYGDTEDTCYETLAIESPKTNYANSKYKAELAINNISDIHPNFNPIILRKGTICGVSPRMRFDLVINTMILNAIKNDEIILNGGGENWRPILYMSDIIKLYYRFITMDDNEYKSLAEFGLFNIFSENYRISELGLRIGNILKVPVIPIYSMKRDIRSYILSDKRAKDYLKFYSTIHLNEVVDGIKSWINFTKEDINDPIFYNIKWLKNCIDVSEISGNKFSLLD
jgi:nucleoside-diphosphate-sugar epimerase